MKLKETTLPPMHLAVSNDGLRPALNHILVKDGIAYASDAHILAVANLSKCTDLKPDQISALNGKTFNKEAWRLIHNADILSVTDTGVVIKKGVLHAEIKSTESMDLKMPDFQKTVRDGFECESISDLPLSIDPRLMDICQKIISTDHIIVSTKKGYRNFCFDPTVKGIFCFVMGKMVNGPDQFNLNDFI